MIVPDSSNQKIFPFPPRKTRKGRSKKEKVLVVRPGYVPPTRERLAQNGGVVRDYMPETPNSRVMIPIHKAKCECLLDNYLRAGKIDESEFEAGMQFRNAWLIKAEGIKTKDSSEVSLAGRSGKLFDPMTDKTWAEKILSEAFKEAGLSVAQSLILQQVCGADNPIGHEYSFKTLHRALEKLARFWNFS